ncbi:MAG: hypothetical protein HYT40_02910 [Candidatus Sungbacteria bacterium]|uniref:Uncharacterized protein n=1 Tax=Candidatus Sungiibacteriota bacterium TaxID=2750080 RepID=A0A931SBV3_9BACT|nr:hypothetical protein [Candidatus Sungbacteria bacterium]
MPLHTSMAMGRWRELTFLEQMGNIGSEVGRMRLVEGRSPGESEKALERALELIDLTRADPRWSTPSRLKELCRLREIMMDAAEGGHEYNSALEDIDRYLMQFAKAARRDK